MKEKKGIIFAVICIVLTLAVGGCIEKTVSKSVNSTNIPKIGGTWKLETTTKGAITSSGTAIISVPNTNGNCDIIISSSGLKINGLINSNQNKVIFSYTTETAITHSTIEGYTYLNGDKIILTPIIRTELKMSFDISNDLLNNGVEEYFGYGYYSYKTSTGNAIGISQTTQSAIESLNNFFRQMTTTSGTFGINATKY